MDQTPASHLSTALTLFANDLFYRAFSARDLNAMSALWSLQHPVFCLHPGWPALFGRDAVLESWSRILGNAQAPKITAYGAQVMTSGGIAVVVCYEQLDGGVCVASNGFVLEGDAVRMLWHQSGRCDAAPANQDAEPNWQ